MTVSIVYYEVHQKEIRKLNKIIRNLKKENNRYRELLASINIEDIKN